MTSEKSTLRIKAEKLGTVAEVTSLLTDLEFAYNSIYAFDFLVETLTQERERNIRQVDERFYMLRKFWREFSDNKEKTFEPYIFEMFFEDYIFNRTNNISQSLLELQSKIVIDKVVLTKDRLYISKVNIQSPGFWEVIGSLNPLQQIREYINDRHERKKDNEYRSKQEKEIGELEIEERKNRVINQRIETLKALGYSDTEIRPLVMTMIIEPLNRLDKHQDNGQIEGIDE